MRRWRIRVLAVAVAGATLLGAAAVAPAQEVEAAFTDAETAKASVTAGTVAQPTAVSCTVQTLLNLGLVFSSATVTWTSPYAIGDQILVVSNSTSSGRVASANITKTGSTYKAVLDQALLQGLLNNLLGATSTLTLSHQLSGTNWTSAPLLYTLKVGGVLGLVGPSSCTLNP